MHRVGIRRSTCAAGRGGPRAARGGARGEPRRIDNALDIVFGATRARTRVATRAQHTPAAPHGSLLEAQLEACAAPLFHTTSHSTRQPQVTCPRDVAATRCGPRRCERAPSARRHTHGAHGGALRRRRRRRLRRVCRCCCCRPNAPLRRCPRCTLQASARCAAAAGTTPARRARRRCGRGREASAASGRCDLHPAPRQRPAQPQSASFVTRGAAAGSAPAARPRWLPAGAPAAP